MTKIEIFEKLKEMVVEQLDVDASNVTMDTEIIKGLNADSLDLVELLMNVESEWDLTIDDGDVADMVRISDVVNYIADNID